jgi:hypothetical protein
LKNGNSANVGFEAQLFLAVDTLRKNLEPSEYKHQCGRWRSIRERTLQEDMQSE